MAKQDIRSQGGADECTLKWEAGQECSEAILSELGAGIAKRS